MYPICRQLQPVCNKPPYPQKVNERDNHMDKMNAAQAKQSKQSNKTHTDFSARKSHSTANNKTHITTFRTISKQNSVASIHYSFAGNIKPKCSNNMPFPLVASCLPCTNFRQQIWINSTLFGTNT